MACNKKINLLTRRKMLSTVAMGVGSLYAAPLLGSQLNVGNMGALSANAHFGIALSGLQRHKIAEEIRPDLIRYKAKGYTGIWIENDYLRWTYKSDPDQGFSGNWRLYNIFDFTLSKEKKLYCDYLHQLSDICKEIGLDIYASFWMPKLNVELLDYLNKNHPDAVGRVEIGRSKECDWIDFMHADYPEYIDRVMIEGKYMPTLCSCEKGGGLKILGGMVEQFMREFPMVKGIKLATEDNTAWNCDVNCTNAHGTNKAQHAANMFETVQKAMLKVRPDAKFLLYPWFWSQDFKDTILPKLEGNYLVVTKMESESVQQLESGIPGELINDSSIVSEKPGLLFKEWVGRVGADRIIDMIPISNGVDDFFISNHPHPGRIYRRLKILAENGVNKFLDFECGGHHAGANEEAVCLFNEQPDLSEDEFFKTLAARTYSKASARDWAIKGWKAFDKGFGLIPMGLGDNNSAGYSGRFGYAWPQCIALPLEQHAFGGERCFKIHWFSPYNFIHIGIVNRLEIFFQQVLTNWQDSARLLGIADALEGRTSFSNSGVVSAQANTLAIISVLNWCLGARLAANPTNKGSFKDLMIAEIKLTEEFAALVNENPWVWDNNCWHPHATPLSSHTLGFEGHGYTNVFAAKLEIMRKLISD